MEYITEMLGIEIVREKWNETNKLPYSLLDEYEFQSVKLDDCKCIFIKPKEEMAVINTIKKHLIAIRRKSNLPIVFELDRITRQKLKSLIENKIPFIITGKQIYLPFMGIALQEKFDCEWELSFEKMLPSAQMILFDFIYGKCKPVYLSEAAKRLDITPMSASRAARQLKKFGLVNIQTEGRFNLLCCELSPQELFEKAQNYLVNPIRKTVYINKDMIEDSMFKSGLSALALYGMLNPPLMEVYGSTGQMQNIKYDETLTDTEKQCVLEFWKYDTEKLSKGNKADILSLAVSFAQDNDMRIQTDIENLLKEKVWN